ncbi:MAG: DNA primase catalytic subunit PriS [Candidatus Heimdallarchaeota archaeon]|nr:DNA primase catalytic subunit PriS [Candidatus Heimdallarchaeota archaeon]
MNSTESENTKTIPTALIQRYYDEIFDPGDLLSTIGFSTFYKREFAFLLEGNIFVRNISFKDTSELVRYLTTNPVRRSYVGAVYETPPSKQNSIQKIKWVSREFCFDLDLNDYDLVRTCGCQGKEQYCSICWSLVQDSAAFLDKTLREDFGFRDIVWVFSGRRGFHGWVRDPIAGKLEQEQRNSMVRYLSLIKDETRTQAVEKDLKYVIPLRDRILEMIAKSYFEKATDKELRAEPFKFTGKQIERMRYNLKNSTKPFYTIYDSILESRQNRDAIFTHIITYRYPRIDRKVSIDIRRILKIPRGVQDTNGRICCLVDIKKIHDFYPENAPTIFEELDVKDTFS